MHVIGSLTMESEQTSVKPASVVAVSSPCFFSVVCLSLFPLWSTIWEFEDESGQLMLQL